MQSGIDSSRLRIAAETTMPSRADAAPAETADNESSACMQIGVKNPTKTGSCVAPTTMAANGSNKSFFGPEGPSFRDVLDAINPLNQIPVVADVLANVTGHQPSTASKLAGGAIATLITGPIGLVATIASVAFEDGAGASPANAIYAAITGDTETAVASAEATTEMAKADTAVEPVEAMQLALLQPAAADDGAYEAVQRDVAKAVAKSNKGDAVLDLYGNSTASAHASYKKAQLLPYLRDVNQTKMM